MSCEPPSAGRGDGGVVAIPARQAKLPSEDAGQETKEKGQPEAGTEGNDCNSRYATESTADHTYGCGGGHHALDIASCLLAQEGRSVSHSRQVAETFSEGQDTFECHATSKEGVLPLPVTQPSMPHSSSSTSAPATPDVPSAHSAGGTGPTPASVSPRMLEQVDNRGENDCLVKCGPYRTEGGGHLEISAPETQSREDGEDGKMRVRLRPLPLTQHRDPLARLPFSRSASTGTCASSTPNCSDSVTSEEMSPALTGSELQGEVRHKEHQLVEATGTVEEGTQVGEGQEMAAPPPQGHDSAAASGNRHDTNWPGLDGSCKPEQAAYDPKSTHDDLMDGADYSGWSRETRSAVVTGTPEITAESLQQAEASPNASPLSAPASVPLASTILADRRSVFYKTQMCPHALRGRCRLDKGCSFAHHKRELRAPPRLDKTKMCASVKAGVSCPKGDSCSFAHSRSELRHTVAFYKTNMCRNWQAGACSHPQTCNHAHGMYELLFFRTLAAGAGCRDFRKEKEVYRGDSPVTCKGTVAGPEADGGRGSLGSKLSVNRLEELRSPTNMTGSAEAEDHRAGNSASCLHYTATHHDLHRLLASLPPSEGRQPGKAAPLPVAPEAEPAQRHVFEKRFVARKRKDDAGGAKSPLSGTKGGTIDRRQEGPCPAVERGAIPLPGRIVSGRADNGDVTGLPEGAHMRASAGKGRRRKKGASFQEKCKTEEHMRATDPVWTAWGTEKLKIATAAGTVAGPTVPITRGDRDLSGNTSTMSKKAGACPLGVASGESSAGMTGPAMAREQQLPDNIESSPGPRLKQRRPSYFEAACGATRRSAGARKSGSQMASGSTVEEEGGAMPAGPAAAPLPSKTALLQGFLADRVSAAAAKGTPSSPSADPIQAQLPQSQRQLLVQLHHYHQAQLEKFCPRTIHGQRRSQVKGREHMRGGIHGKSEGNLDGRKDPDAPTEDWGEVLSSQNAGGPEGIASGCPFFATDGLAKLASKNGDQGDSVCFPENGSTDATAMALAYTLLLCLRESAPGHLSNESADSAGLLRNFPVPQFCGDQLLPSEAEAAMPIWTERGRVKGQSGGSRCDADVLPHALPQHVTCLSSHTDGQPGETAVTAQDAPPPSHLTDLQEAINRCDAFPEGRPENQLSADLWSSRAAYGEPDVSRSSGPCLSPRDAGADVISEYAVVTKASQKCINGLLALAAPGEMGADPALEFGEAQANLSSQSVTSIKGQRQAGIGMGLDRARWMTPCLPLASVDDVAKTASVPRAGKSFTRNSAMLSRVAGAPRRSSAATEDIVARLNAALDSISDTDREIRVIDELLRYEQQRRGEDTNGTPSVTATIGSAGAAGTGVTLDRFSTGTGLLPPAIWNEGPPKGCASADGASGGRGLFEGGHRGQQMRAGGLSGPPDTEAQADIVSSASGEHESCVGRPQGKSFGDIYRRLDGAGSNGFPIIDHESCRATGTAPLEAPPESSKHPFFAVKGSVNASQRPKDGVATENVSAMVALPESGRPESSMRSVAEGSSQRGDKQEMAVGFDLVSLTRHGSTGSSTASSDTSGGTEQWWDVGIRGRQGFTGGDPTRLRGDQSLPPAWMEYQDNADAQQRQARRQSQGLHASVGYASDSEPLATATSRETLRGVRAGSGGAVRTDDKSVRRAAIRVASYDASKEQLASYGVGDSTVEDIFFALSRVRDNLDCAGADAELRMYDLYKTQMLLQGAHNDGSLSDADCRGGGQTSCSVGVYPTDAAAAVDAGGSEPAAGHPATLAQERGELPDPQVAHGRNYWLVGVPRLEPHSEQDAGAGATQVHLCCEGVERQYREQSLCSQRCLLPETLALGEMYRPAGVDPLTLIESMVHALGLEG